MKRRGRDDRKRVRPPRAHMAVANIRHEAKFVALDCIRGITPSAPYLFFALLGFFFGIIASTTDFGTPKTARPNA